MNDDGVKEGISEDAKKPIQVDDACINALTLSGRRQGHLGTDG